mmetsp:Transcript_139549/g.389226  ORF Transcript_139549/g.389226 Transcript_139549/m.389226 type:complete len:209 (-) Transcript_139549:739-1365(-)
MSPYFLGALPFRTACASTSSCSRPPAAPAAAFRSTRRCRTSASRRRSNSRGSTRSMVSLMRGCFTCSSSKCSWPMEGEALTSMSHTRRLVSSKRSYPKSSKELTWCGMWSSAIQSDFRITSIIRPHTKAQSTPRACSRSRNVPKEILVPPNMASRWRSRAWESPWSPCNMLSSLCRWIEEFVRWTNLLSISSGSVVKGTVVKRAKPSL